MNRTIGFVSVFASENTTNPGETKAEFDAGTRMKGLGDATRSVNDNY